MVGSISLLVDSPLRDLAFAMREVPADVRKHIASETRKHALPIWNQELRERAATRFQQRALVSSARVGVTARNVFLRSGSVGKLSSGTPVVWVSTVAEWGFPQGKKVDVTNRKGKTFQRSMGAAVPARRRGGWVVHPAAQDAIPRFASLWIQTARRSLHEAEEKA
ncbi:hypothetical protein QE392_001394 [Microbacterium proteolyticum]|uniref:hypothetical protein n=1 Tax=Microbacterium proteolyticum TaxID=1572644 RepID=UPI00277DF05A|nr:hypothetical protein [Microbacterium proteolyticum]MDQ1169590.1 hypothetical protein [Microbacterium proteolyticum]